MQNFMPSHHTLWLLRKVTYLIFPAKIVFYLDCHFLHTFWLEGMGHGTIKGNQNVVVLFLESVGGTGFIGTMSTHCIGKILVTMYVFCSSVLAVFSLEPNEKLHN